ncbi:MAG TPA: dihydrofolate reductase family protein [Solirubrobacteraceae bacterium]|nr:dihydrofolate reductase family protein [Solirubrobacteraceae bacterium]
MGRAAFNQDIPSFLEPITSAGAMTVAVMVGSVDGRATIDGRVGELTGPADQQLLHWARERASAIVVGGRTVHAEGYDGLLGDEAKARRQARGVPPEPELVVFTRESPSPPELWAQLRERHPDQLIVCEGGPTLLGFVIEHGLLDQLVLCVSPKIVGDDSQQRLLSHSGALGIDVELLAATADQSFLFLRYGLR